MVEFLLFHGADPTITDGYHGESALQWAQRHNHPVCVAALQPRTTACLRRWSADSNFAFSDEFRLAIAVLLRQVSRQKPPAVPKVKNHPLGDVFGIGRMAGIACCAVKDPVTGRVRDVDLLQEYILDRGLLDCDWFTLDPAKRLRTWLRRERRPLGVLWPTTR